MQENIISRILIYPYLKISWLFFTGVSGSGKSSLAFDTIYNEGQRRYMESFSAYARQFLGDMERPDVDKITGLRQSFPLNKKPPIKTREALLAL